MNTRTHTGATEADLAVLIPRLLTAVRAVAQGGSLGSILDQVAHAAALVAEARAASVLLTYDSPPDEHGQGFRVGGLYRLGKAYRHRIDRATGLAFSRKGINTKALELKQPVVVEDTDSDPIYVPWVDVARSEGYRSVVSVPLLFGGTALGTLDAYRSSPGTWSQRHLDLLVLFAENSVGAIRTAQLLEHQKQQLDSLERAVAALREQGHEHANRIHTVAGLLRLKEYGEAERFLADVEGSYYSTSASVLDRIAVPTIAGLVISEAAIARQRGITITVDQRSRLTQLPHRLGEAEALTIVANLLRNACEAVATVPKARRRVTLSFRTTQDCVEIAVRDWGVGVPDALVSRLFERGFTSKQDHAGLGLPIAVGAAAAAGGHIMIDRLSVGTRVRAIIPNGEH